MLTGKESLTLLVQFSLPTGLDWTKPALDSPPCLRIKVLRNSFLTFCRLLLWGDSWPPGEPHLVHSVVPPAAGTWLLIEIHL